MPLRFLGGPSRSEITNVLVTDSLWETIFYNMILFQSIDGYSFVDVGLGGQALTANILTLSTGAVNPGSAELQYYMSIVVGTTPILFTWDKERRIRTALRIASAANQTAYVVSGRGNGPFQYAGFKIVNDKVYGVVNDGTGETLTAALFTFVAGADFLVEARFTPGVACRFYIDGVFIAQITTGLPAGVAWAEWLMNLYIENGVAANKTIAIDRWEFYQVR